MFSNQSTVRKFLRCRRLFLARNFRPFSSPNGRALQSPGRMEIRLSWPRARPVDTTRGVEAVGILGGEPKCCKSFLALDLAVSVASGAPCLRQLPANPSVSHPLNFPRFSRKHRHRLPSSLSNSPSPMNRIEMLQHLQKGRFRLDGRPQADLNVSKPPYDGI